MLLKKGKKREAAILLSGLNTPAAVSRSAEELGLDISAVISLLGVHTVLRLHSQLQYVHYMSDVVLAQYYMAYGGELAEKELKRRELTVPSRYSANTLIEAHEIFDKRRASPHMVRRIEGFLNVLKEDFGGFTCHTETRVRTERLSEYASLRSERYQTVEGVFVTVTEHFIIVEPEQDRSRLIKAMKRLSHVGSYELPIIISAVDRSTEEENEFRARVLTVIRSIENSARERRWRKPSIVDPHMPPYSLSGIEKLILSKGTGKSYPQDVRCCRFLCDISNHAGTEIAPGEPIELHEFAELFTNIRAGK